MTNGEKYQTAQERAEAFSRFCDSQETCTMKCPAHKNITTQKWQCVIEWLDLEAEVDKPLPCPCCGADAEIHYEDDIDREGDASIQCKECFLMTPDYPSDVEAVVAWNRRMSNQKESEVK